MIDTESLESAKKKQSPAEIANTLLSEHNFVCDRAGTTFRWNGKFWEDVPPVAMSQLALKADGYRRSISNRRSEIIDQIKARSYDADLEWGRVKDSEIAFENGVLDFKIGKLREHRPADYLERVLPWKWDAAAKCPVWQETLESWFGELSDESGLSAGGEIEALQEFIGYSCTSHAKYKKALFLLGESDTGKSVVAYVLALLVGRARCCTLPLDEMNDPQARAVIIGKAINLITEIDSQALIADGGFKTFISTEEPIHINAKYKQPFDYWPTAKHIFLSNNLPRLNDRTEAVLNRLLIVQFTRVFAPDEQDEMLQEKLAAEIPGILVWAVEGAKRLISHRGKFTQPTRAKATLDQLRREANPVLDFISERLAVSDTGTALSLSELVSVFNSWNKGSRGTNVRGLGKMLRAAGQVVKDVRHGEAILKSLVGFHLIEERAPALLNVDQADVVSERTEIASIATPATGERVDGDES